MKKHWLIFLFPFFLVCCNSGSKNNENQVVTNESNHIDKNNYEQTKGGLYYKYIEKTNSALIPEEGNKLVLDLKYYNEKDSLLFSSQDIPGQFIIDFFKPIADGSSINDAYAMMHEDDSMSFLINAYKFYLTAGQKQEIEKVTKDENLRFEVRLKKILSPEIVKKEQQERETFLKEEEDYLLEDYLRIHFPDTKPTKSGLYYIETQAGTGSAVSPNSIVTIHYNATYINGEPIYSTYATKDPLTFAVDDPYVWPCLAEAVQYMKKGGKATILAISKLAAGEQGDKSMHIPPRKTIIFNLELVGIN